MTDKIATIEKKKGILTTVSRLYPVSGDRVLIDYK
tara:strand:+ start:703 stop:807 length:105 start_codon:yes stop_codon:yes gene_type:complete